MFHVRTMSTDDIDFAVHLTSLVNWNMSRADFEFMMELEPEGCFILLQELERIGLATNVSFGRVGWFGNLLVKEEFRKKGAGSQLVLHSIKYLRSKNVATVALYAYLDVVPLYKKLDFTYDSNYVVLVGKGFSSPPNASMRQAKNEDLQRIIEYDQSCLGSNRRKLLEPIMLDSDNICYVSTDDKRILGYAIAKVYDGMAELGPLVCNQSRDDIAIDLLKTALNRLKGFEVSMFVPNKETKILNALRTFGFEERFQVARMFNGPPINEKCILFAESLERG